MQNERQTAGETATIYNRFEEEIFRLNRERDEKLEYVINDMALIRAERETLKLQKQEHFNALHDINVRLEELNATMKDCNSRGDEIRRECKQAKARVIEEANAHYEKFPGENWLWKKVYRFFKKNPDVCLQIMKEEGGEQ